MIVKITGLLLIFLFGLILGDNIPQLHPRSGKIIEQVSVENQKKINASNETIKEKSNNKKVANDPYIEIFQLEKDSNYKKKLDSLGSKKLAVLNFEEGLAIQLLLTYWSEKDPAAAWSWAINNPKKTDGTRSLFKIMIEYLRTDPIGAEQALEDLSDSSLNIKSEALEVAATNFFMITL